MAVKIAFINGKGGVGKTTGVFHVAGVLSKTSEKVLVLDFDKQKNISRTLFKHTKVPVHTIYDVMMGANPETAVAQAMFQTRENANPKYYGVSCMAGDSRLASEMQIERIDGAHFGDVLNTYIVREGYTWVLADLPPSNNAINDLCFSHVVDSLIVPFSVDIYSVEGYGDTMDMVQGARGLNPKLNILGIYLSRYMNNCGAHNFIKSELLKFGSIFLDVQIPEANAHITECAMFGRPLSYYKKPSGSAARRAYESLVEEIKRRV